MNRLAAIDSYNALDKQRRCLDHAGMVRGDQRLTCTVSMLQVCNDPWHQNLERLVVVSVDIGLEGDLSVSFATSASETLESWLYHL